MSAAVGAVSLTLKVLHFDGFKSLVRRLNEASIV